MWTAVSVLKKQYSRKGSVESGGVAVSGLCNRIPLDSIYDIVIGSLNCGVGESNSAQLSTGSVLSIITATHSLEFELDVSEISTSSCYITDNTLYRINSKSSRDSTVNDMRATTASAFARPSSIFSFNADGGTQGKSPQELASCPQVLSRHPFYKALRMVLLIQGHIRMVNFITTSLLNSGVSTARKATVSTLQTTLETRKRGAGMRPADRARVISFCDCIFCQF